jgi:hypothetical protein
MSEQGDKSANLERVSDELLRSLRRCRVMMSDYRSKLTAANSNEPSFMLSSDRSDDDGERTG